MGKEGFGGEGCGGGCYGEKGRMELGFDFQGTQWARLGEARVLLGLGIEGGVTALNCSDVYNPLPDSYLVGKVYL